MKLLRIHLGLGVVGWVLVEVRQENGLAVGRLDMFAGAPVTVSARSDLVVEAAVDLVLLSTEDRREIVGHGDVGDRRWMKTWRCRCRRRNWKRDFAKESNILALCCGADHVRAAF